MIEPRREVLFGWGMAHHARSWVYRPSDPEEVAEAVADARRRGLTIVHRGAGQSYGDAALNQGGATLLTGGLDRILDYDPERGMVRAQAGVTVDALWRRVIADGWWPPVVPGTSRPTLGGCLAMNVHGKNHVQAGSFAEHVRSVTVMDAEGDVRTHEAGTEGFDRHAGAQGLSGTILALELTLQRVHSGYLAVEARSVPDLGAAMETLRALETGHDYTVGWLDGFATGDRLGRGELHAASYLTADHEQAGEGLSREAQHPHPRLFGLVPRDRAAGLLGSVVSDIGIRGLNAAKYGHARLSHPSSYLESHARFHFLLDFLPGWKQAYEPGGLLQYQLFVPDDAAHDALREALRRQHRHGVVSYLCVLKRHREDPFPISYAVDGWSLALDFPVRERQLADLMALLDDLDAVQRNAGGRVYAAKDAVSRLGRLPDERDPHYSSNLSRRWAGA